MATMLYEAPSHYGRGMRLLFLAILLALVIPAIFTFDSDRESAFGMLGTVLLIAFIMWFVMPRRVRIMEDRVQVILGPPFTFTVPFATIKEASIPKGLSSGINFCTAFTGVVKISRFRKMNINITPADPEVFLEQLGRALKSYAEQKESK